MKFLQTAVLALAIVSTSVALSPGHADRIEQRFESVPMQMLMSTVRISVTNLGKQGAGSGVCISDKHILTCAHLFDHGPMEDAVIAVQLKGKKHDSLNTLDARIIKIDTTLDIAILEVDGTLPFSSEVDTSSETSVGDALFVLGAPGGFSANYAVQGFLATKGEGKNPFADMTGWEHCWSTSARTDQGNSGGPIFNANTGKVIGVLRGGPRGYGVSLFTPVTLVKKWFK